MFRRSCELFVLSCDVLDVLWIGLGLYVPVEGFLDVEWLSRGGKQVEDCLEVLAGLR